MKYIERSFYCCRLIRYPFPIDDWFALKDRYFGGAHAGEACKRRHRRSIAKRDLCRLMRGRIVDYYEHKYRTPNRATITPNPTWEWYLERRAK